MGLGAFPLVTLAEAREKAFDNRRLARSGGDPRAARRRASVPTFREATRQTFDALRPVGRAQGVQPYVDVHERMSAAVELPLPLAAVHSIHEFLAGWSASDW